MEEITAPLIIKILLDPKNVTKDVYCSLFHLLKERYKFIRFTYFPVSHKVCCWPDSGSLQSVFVSQISMALPTTSEVSWTSFPDEKAAQQGFVASPGSHSYFNLVLNPEFSSYFHHCSFPWMHPIQIKEGISNERHSANWSSYTSTTAFVAQRTKLSTF